MHKIIGFFIILSFLIRILPLLQNSLSFHYDMSRDAFIAREIWRDKDLKIIGPPTSTPGLYHGVLYYYLIAPFYGFGNGDPRFLAVFLAFLSSLTVIPIAMLAKKIFKKDSSVIISALLFAFSFEAAQYGLWLSNPQPALLTVSIFFLGLFYWKSGKHWGLYISALSAALSAQFQFFLIYLVLLIPLFGYLFKLKINNAQLRNSLVLIFLSLSSFIIASYKFNSLNNIVSGFLNISVSTSVDFRDSFSQFFIKYLDNYANLFVNNFFPSNVVIGGIIAFAVLFTIRKNYFLIFCLLSNIPIFAFGGHSNIYANIGLITPAILGIIIVKDRIYQYKKPLAYVFISLLIFSNIYTIFKQLPNGQLSLVIPNEMILKNQLALIDKTYQVTAGKPFSINSLTLPLWSNTTWAYLYDWYGQKKYGYLPSFYGKDQINQLGEHVFQKTASPSAITFFIIEPHTGIPASIYDQEISEENSKTKLIEKLDFNGLILEQRAPL